MSDELSVRLAERIELVLDAYYPGWETRRGVAYPAPSSPHDWGSFQVMLEGEKRGMWYRFSEGLGGDALALVAYAETGRPTVTRATFDRARVLLGEAPGRPVTAKVVQLRPQKRSQQVPAADAALQRLWERGQPIPGTPAEQYLINRGLSRVVLAGASQNLLYMPCLRHRQGGEWPALLGRVEGPNGAMIGLWRIYLTTAGQKAPVEPVKMGMGRSKGGGVWIFERRDPSILHVCEGIETALGIYHILLMAGGGRQTKAPVVAALSTSGMASFEPPPGAQKVLVWPDGDVDRMRGDTHTLAPGLAAALMLQKRLGPELCSVQAPPPYGMDYLDVYGRAKRSFRLEEIANNT